MLGINNRIESSYELTNNFSTFLTLRLCLWCQIYKQKTFKNYWYV